MSDIDLVMSRLEELEKFLRGYDVLVWPDTMRRVRLESKRDRQVLKRRVLDMYKGTMGSLTDLIIARVNRHKVDDETAANERLARLRHDLWELTMAL